MGSKTRSIANNLNASLGVDNDTITPATDLQPVKSDISALALREATNESSAAFNLPGQFIETFTDDTNLGTQTDCDRVDGYMATVFQNDVTTTNITLLDVGGDAGDRAEDNLQQGNSYFIGNAFYVAPNTKVIIDEVYFRSHGTGGSQTGCMYVTPDNSNAPSNLDPNSVDGNNRHDFSYSSVAQGSYVGGTLTNVQTFDNLAGASNLRAWFMIGKFGTGFSGGMIQGKAVGGGSQNDYYNPSGNNTVTPMGTSLDNTYASGVSREISSNESMSYKVVGDKVVRTTTSNPNGTLIQSANAVSGARTKVGGTLLYKDNAGTNYLGTELKVYFTCDGGSNWTEASSYTTITPVFSTGIKQVRLGETTCTSGQDVRYKITWESQNSGVKEAQVHGIGINY